MTDKRKVFFKIIVPNFNNYIYIKKCLDSIKEQTFKDYVCIVVDDLSTDDSFKIAQIYAKRDPEHFIAIKMDKKGHEGGARNRGIDYPIDCEYYYFVDSDDYLYSQDVLNNLYEHLKYKNIDILIAKMIQLNQNGTFSIIEQKKFNFNDINMFLGGFNSACIKLVKYEKIQYFLEMCDHASDVFYTMKLFDNSEKIKQIDDIIYVYRRNKNSITLNGKYKSDTEKFYNAVDTLSKTIKNTNVLNAILYRIKCYKTNKIDF